MGDPKFSEDDVLTYQLVWKRSSGNVRNPNHHSFSKKYRNAPSNLFYSTFGVRKGKSCQHSSHLYHSMPPVCIAIRLTFVSHCFWEILVVVVTGMLSKMLLQSATKMTGRPGHWSEPGEYNILFLGSILVISSQDSSALGYREFIQEGPMTVSPFPAREGTSAPQ